MPFLDGSVRVNGLALHYTEWGAPDAPPVVLLHGITGHARVWDTLARALEPRFRVLAWTVDLVTPAERGKAIGTYYTAIELGIAAGAIGFGLVLARSSFSMMFAAAGVPALAGAGLAAARLRR